MSVATKVTMAAMAIVASAITVLYRGSSGRTKWRSESFLMDVESSDHPFLPCCVDYET
jgi:hypothetical protein